MKTSTERSLVILIAICGLLALAGCETVPSTSLPRHTVTGHASEDSRSPGTGSGIARKEIPIAVEGYAYYSENPFFNNMTTMTAPSSMEDMLISRLKTKALIQSSQAGKWALKLEKGDSFSITSSSQCPVGVGSEMRFSHENWIDLCGQKYRNGGFSVKDSGVVFVEGTERNDGGNVMKYTASQWKVSQ